MQISLDYYRILGVPIQAESQLIEQAYQDRLVQLPHHHYTEYAIASRRNLVKKAYEILGDEQARLEYESSFFKIEHKESQTLDDFEEASIEIENDLFIGGLIILFDLGEYELVVRLAKPYLQEENRLQKLSPKEEELTQIKQDLVLTVVLARLELARERWHDNEYDNAADSLREANRLLTQENLFNNITKEIQQDIGKLRPYQILELLTKDDNSSAPREKGVELLKEMFNARGGIETQKVDESGLNVDGFLRFIQQIRCYLTVSEQQEIFEIEARRPSNAATYLAACACLAKGVTKKNPDLVLDAKNYLISLTIHQDIYLEQSICALLLGQTAEAEFSLGQSKEQKVIDYIKDVSASADAPDLLPGLCLYTEKWLQTEIFPQYLDLKNRVPSLQEYFADLGVQQYLENLSPTVSRQKIDAEDASATQSLPAKDLEANSLLTNFESEDVALFNLESENSPEQTSESDNLGSFDEYLNTDVPEYSFTDSPPTAPENNQPASETQTPLVTESDKQLPAQKSSEAETTSVTRRKKPSQIGNNIIIAILTTLLVFMGIAYAAWRTLFKGGAEEQLEISLTEPVIELPNNSIPSPNIGGQGAIQVLDNNSAIAIINQWLEAKKEATGPNYNFNKLEQILTNPLANLWIANGKTLREQNAYRRYEHEIEIVSAQINPQNANQGIIQAKIKEKSQYYRNGALNADSSYEDDLVVKYVLIKEGNRWLINEITVLN